MRNDKRYVLFFTKVIIKLAKVFVDSAVLWTYQRAKFKIYTPIYTPIYQLTISLLLADD